MCGTSFDGPDRPDRKTGQSVAIFRGDLRARRAGERPPLGRLEEVLEGDVQERGPRLGEDAPVVVELAADADAPSVRAALEPGADAQLAVDRHRSSVADEQARRHRRKAGPG